MQISRVGPYALTAHWK